MRNRARWHHYVPQLHLRLFAADPGGRFIYRHDKRTNRTEYRAIRGVGGRPDYFTVRGPDGLPSDALEQAFGRIETDVASVLRRLATHPSGSLALSPRDRVNVSRYVALQFARVPNHVETSRQMAEYLGSASMEMIYATSERFRDFNRRQGSTATDDELEVERVAGLERLRSGQWSIPDGHEMAIGAIGDAVDAIAPVVHAMNWSLIRRSRPPWFVLGDTPVTLYAENLPRGMGVGFLTEGAEVHMPISPTHALVATRVENPLAEEVVEFHSAEVANGINTEIWASAIYNVFGSSTDAIHAARHATPEVLRGFREPRVHIGGGPAEWERYKPGGRDASIDGETSGERGPG